MWQPLKIPISRNQNIRKNCTISNKRALAFQYYSQHFLDLWIVLKYIIKLCLSWNTNELSYLECIFWWFDKNLCIFRKQPQKILLINECMFMKKFCCICHQKITDGIENIFFLYATTCTTAVINVNLRAVICRDRYSFLIIGWLKTHKDFFHIWKILKFIYLKQKWTDFLILIKSII